MVYSSPRGSLSSYEIYMGALGELVEQEDKSSLTLDVEIRLRLTSRLMRGGAGSVKYGWYSTSHVIES